MKTLIVGEAPSKNEATERPLEGRVGRRLAALCDMTMPEFLDRFDRVNLLHVRQDTKEKGFAFDRDSAIVAGIALRKEWPTGSTFILLGNRVASAMGIPSDYPKFTRYMADHDYYVMPHPSGVNRWWNDPDNVTKAEEFLRQIAERTRA